MPGPNGHPPDFRVRVGVDLVSVDRLEGILRDHPRAATTLFTKDELAYCHGRRRAGDHLAARFAAKEAVLKALGTGISQRMRWTDVEVVNEPGTGRPRINLAGAAESFGRRRGLEQLEVSLSHTGGLALAHVLTVWRRPCAST
jgi:holo-[acyl-carrier protein] synthase